MSETELLSAEKSFNLASVFREAARIQMQSVKCWLVGDEDLIVWSRKWLRNFNGRLRSLATGL